MTIYWTIANIPELAPLTPAERRRAWRAVFWKAHRHWQVWLSLVPMCVLIAVGSKKLGRAFNAVSKTERWARLLTGGAILLCGTWITLAALLQRE